MWELLLRTAFKASRVVFCVMPRTREANRQASLVVRRVACFLLLLSLVEKATWLPASWLCTNAILCVCVCACELRSIYKRRFAGELERRSKRQMRVRGTYLRVLKKVSHVTCLSLDATKEIRFSSNSPLPTIAICSSNWLRTKSIALDTLNEFRNSKTQ